MSEIAADGLIAGPHRKRILAVIGPGSPDSRGLWREIKEQDGWLAVAVMPPDAARRGLTNPPDQGGWDAVITANRWEAGLVTRLLTGIDGIIGDEGSIGLVDEVARNLDLPHNDPATSTLRFDKADMTEALRQRGLPVPATFRVANVADAHEAAKATGYPLVIKLPASCAGDRFTICRDPRELEAAWQQMSGQRSILGDVIDSVLVQELLPGPEYAVNHITLAPGEHRVLEVWRDFHPEGGVAAYDRFEMLDVHDTLYEPLIERATEALDATGVRWGPSHTELMQNAAGEYVVIDLAARVGGWLPRVMRQSSDVAPGPGQAEAAVLAITDPDALRRRLTSRTLPQGKVTLMYMVVPRDGMIINQAVLEEISKLPGVRGVNDFRPGLAAGDRLAGMAVSKSINLVNQVGGWAIAGPADVVDAAIKEIRSLEQRPDGLYQPG